MLTEIRNFKIIKYVNFVDREPDEEMPRTVWFGAAGHVVQTLQVSQSYSRSAGNYKIVQYMHKYIRN
jgi:hypothetical protein